MCKYYSINILDVYLFQKTNFPSFIYVQRKGVLRRVLIKLHDMRPPICTESSTQQPALLQLLD